MVRDPVFVGGLSRSGKTLMCSLLASHPNIAIPLRESNLWAYFYRQYGNLEQDDNFERCLAAILRYKGALRLNPNPDRIREEFWKGEPTYARLFALFHSQYAEQLGKPRWGVQSVSEEQYVDLVFAAYPTAKAIHMVRDPRDRYEAQVTTRRPAGVGGVAVATAHWLFSIGLAKRYKQRYPHRYEVVRYETLVRQPEKTIHDVFNFLNEDFPTDGFGVRNTPQYKNQNISPAFIGRFHQVMTNRQIAFMQAYAKQDMLAFNYELEPVKFSVGDYPLYYLLDQPVNLGWVAGWHIWKRLQLKFPAQLGSTPLPKHLVSS